MRLLYRAQSLERDDRLASDISQDNRAGPCELSADQSRAGTALPETAAKLWTVQSEIVPQHIQQRRLQRRGNLMGLTVHRNSVCHPSLPKLEAAWRSSDLKARSTRPGPPDVWSREAGKMNHKDTLGIPLMGIAAPHQGRSHQHNVQPPCLRRRPDLRLFDVT